MVSEIMLQQTQTSRVSEKFLEFIKRFPDFNTLAKAPLEDILNIWQGLGYNRRAIALKNIAEIIVSSYNGNLPADLDTLKSFPQIGYNTASSILVFAFNIPTYFIETNIRRVYIYFFFQDKKIVNDKDVLKLTKKTIDLSNPRDWYYGLMDYGVMLKRNHPELNKKSVHYQKQSKFKGSNREIRGEILKMLLEEKALEEIEIIQKIDKNPERVKKILNTMSKEGFIKKINQNYTISD
ncbi:MAG: A/G-specific adenine glycosylase [Candidatus Hermodarchaeota archaeon]